MNRLEAMAASMMGKDAALLVPSGTMGNLAAMLTHCARGTKAIVGSQSHTNLYEAGGASALGGIVLTAVTNSEDGELDPHELSRELGTPADDHFAQPSLVVIENTHNRCGGAPIKLSHMAEVSTASTSQKNSAASRRRANLQRSARARDDAEGNRESRGYGFVLPVEGTRMPGGLAAMRKPRIYRARASHSQSARRRNAAGGNNCGGGNRRADHDARSARRGSSECARAGAGIRAGRGTERAPGREPYQHGRVRRRRRRASVAAVSRRR